MVDIWSEQIYTLEQIQRRLDEEDFPFSGITPLKSAGFLFRKPAFYAGTSIHAGHRVRGDMQDIMAVTSEDRHREEDPHTQRFIEKLPIQIIARDSRFEYDINRPPEMAVYQTADMAWGLKVYKRPLTTAELKTTMAKYDEFQSLMDIVSLYLISRHTFGLIFDCHSFNSRRDRTSPWYQDDKPVVNIGTQAVNQEKFRGIINRLITRMERFQIGGHDVTVGENVVFKGGHLARRLSEAHYDHLLVLAVEFKKIFMDEWTGLVDEDMFQQLISYFNMVVHDLIAVDCTL